MARPEKKLFLLDAMALIYRAHFAFSKAPRVTSTGLNTSAVFGFTNTLLEVLNKEKPTHLGVAFDTAAPTFRHVNFPAYKAQREAQPEDITIAIPLVIRLLKAFNIPVLMLEGYEADDIIGTMAKHAARNDFEVFMMTPDKDYGQLVEEHVYLYKPAFMGNGVEVLGVPEILQKWEISEIGQVCDILGLQGDAVDNIPGIPGIGEKTAKKLIQEYGSVENLIANADKLKGKQKENVVNFAAQGILSKELATIDINVPLPFDEEDLLLSPPNREAIRALFEELEFKTFIRKVLGEEQTAAATPAAAPKPANPSGQLGLFGGGEAPAAPAQTSLFGEEASQEETPTLPKQTIHTTAHQYHIADTPELRRRLASFLALQSEFCFDTETDSLDTATAELVGLSFAYLATEAFYVPVPKGREQALEVLEDFRQVFENENITKIGQNIKFDWAVLRNYGFSLKGQLYDTMLAHYLLEPDARHNMDVLAEKYLNYSPVSIETLIGKKGKNQGTMRDVPLADIAEYAAEDADITLQLKQIFAPEIKAQELENLLFEVEMPLVKVLGEMEAEGVRVDTAVLAELSTQLGVEVAEIETKIYGLAGETFNIASPLQLGKILFEKLQLDPKAKKTKTGQYATGEEVLSKLAHQHEIVDMILDYREMQKLKSTYIDALPTLIAPHDGRIHTSYNQAVAATGRLSSTNPNLQNIPIRTAKGREIRKAFVPRNEQFQILSADYSQIELRIMASFSGDETMKQAFAEGKDIHRITAAKIYKVTPEEVDSDMRRKAKTANFGIIYGISAFGLAERLNIPRREAAELIEAYFGEFPAVKRYMDGVINTAREQGYVTTQLGRRRYLPDINSRNQTLRGYAERNAINAPIQGTAADMIKLAMIRVQNWLQTQPLQTRMVLQVHDELVFDAYTPEIELITPQIISLMADALPLAVPVEVSVGTGTNWLEAH